MHKTNFFLYLCAINVLFHLLGLKRDDVRVLKMVADSIGGLRFVELGRPNSSEKIWKIIKE